MYFLGKQRQNDFTLNSTDETCEKSIEIRNILISMLRSVKRNVNRRTNERGRRIVKVFIDFVVAMRFARRRK